jgi:hypothetical protein
MTIIKSLVCAVLFVVQVTNAEFYVNCMAAPDATPNATECTDAREDVLDMLGVCTGGLAMEYVGPARRQLRSREQRQTPLPEAEQSNRELQIGCWSFNLNASQRFMCCWFNDPNDPFSYCGRYGGRRLQLSPAGLLNSTALSVISADCTDAFEVLANANKPCFGTPEDVFCETIQLSIG